MLLLLTNHALGLTPLPEAKRPFLCHVPDKVFIGTVVESKSYWHTKGIIHSKVKIKIERNLRNTTETTMDLEIVGGKVDATQSWDTFFPLMPVNSRHLLFLTTVGVKSPVFSHFERLNPDEDLPSSESLQALLASQCRGVPAP